MISAFSVYHHLAARMAQGQILLAGDSAHVISPIGGQGMNLGWLDAWVAAGVLAQAVRASDPPVRLFDIYSRDRRRAASIARRRAEFNMWMGRESRLQGMARLQALKYGTVKRVLNSNAARYFAKRFTMRGL